MKPETRFRIGKVVPFLKSLPHCYFDAVQQLAKRGSPDLYVCIRGLFIGMELKSEHGKPTLLQEQKLKEIEDAGGMGLVVYPENWGGIKTRLIEISEGRYEHKNRKR